MSVGWPDSSPVVREGCSREVPATATARCRSSVSAAIGSGSAASGWWGATQNTNSTRPSGRSEKRVEASAGLGASCGAPITRSARPSASASHAPSSTSYEKRRRVGASSR